MSKQNVKILTSTILLISVTLISFFFERHEFLKLFTAYSICFATYIYVLRTTKTAADTYFYVKIGFLLRGVEIFSLPNLSNDIYRFIWDGRLIHLGINPFDHIPRYYIDNQLFTHSLTVDLFAKMNSPDYFSVYPPVCQSVFFTAVWLFPTSIYGATIVIKACLFLCEIGSVFMMKKILTLQKKHIQSILIYALNPLIIIELCGNAHFEAAMIFFFLMFIYYFLKYVFSVNTKPFQSLILSTSTLALSIASKMLPLMLMPLIWRKLNWKDSLKFWTFTGVGLLIIFLPIYNNTFINNLQSSLKLYVNNFEFNASIFYVARSIGFMLFGYDQIKHITPFLNVIVILFILKKAFFPTKKSLSNPVENDFLEACLFVLCVYFACATTVHPWYAALPLAISVFTRWRFPIVWTFTIFLTYSGYTEGSSKHIENYYLIAIEYIAVVAWFLYEYWQPHLKINTP